jgi:hypothetical protein
LRDQQSGYLDRDAKLLTADLSLQLPNDMVVGEAVPPWRSKGSRHGETRFTDKCLRVCSVPVCPAADGGAIEDGLAAHARGDHATAFQVWKQLAEQGNAPAQHNLAILYAEGQGVPQDHAEALKWYRRAASRGHAAAQLSLGVLYDRGQGVPQSLSRAMKWYRKAAEQGNAVAQITLGRTYSDGLGGVPQNYWQAVKWYRLAAEQNVPVAQTNLGIIYEHGRSVPQDYVQAYKWFSLAAATGNLDAAKKRDAVSAKMTPGADRRGTEARAGLDHRQGTRESREMPNFEPRRLQVRTMRRTYFTLPIPPLSF